MRYLQLRSFLCVGLLACLAWGGGGGWCASPDAYTTRFVSAMRSQSQQHYEEALGQWQQLVADFPNASSTDLAWLHIAQCAVAKKHWEQAEQALTNMHARFSTTPYRAESAVLLFITDLQVNKSDEADHLWQEIFTTWPQSPYTLQAAVALFEATSVKVTPSAMNKCRQALTMEWDELLRMIYPPLIKAGHVEDAVATHEHCQALLDAVSAPETVKDAESDAYRQSLSKDALGGMYTLFANALEKKDMATAQHWLTVMNVVAAAHPRVAEARKRFRAAQQAMKQKTEN